MERVQKILSNAGYCSRRHAEELIKKGKVAVNGKTITIGDQAGPTDKITIDGKILKRERPVYIVFNKPTGCVTAVTDKRFRTVMHYIKCKERVFPVGRLDMNTAGLLLLTNDGTFANNVMHPRYEIKKTYVAEIDKPIGPRNIKKLEQGILLDKEKTHPAKVHRIHPEKIEITIHEGKNRIVRRMLESLGYNVVRLTRTKIGNLELGKLKPGKYRRLHEPPVRLPKAKVIPKKKPKKTPPKNDPRVYVKGFGYSDSVPKKKAPRTPGGKKRVRKIHHAHRRRPK